MLLFSYRWFHSLTAGSAIEHHSNMPYKVKASTYLPIVHTYNLIQLFRLALVISRELAWFHFQCRRRIFVHKVKLRSRHDKQYLSSSPNPILTLMRMLFD
jgi:hypothetical protein